jgi:hypothetical protein
LDKRDEEIKELRFLLSTPMWQSLIAPRITAKLALATDKLVKGGLKKAEENRLRGRIEALSWMLYGPSAEIREYDVAKQQEEEYNKVDKEEAFLAEYGTRSPFLPPSEADPPSNPPEA